MIRQTSISSQPQPSSLIDIWCLRIILGSKVWRFTEVSRYDHDQLVASWWDPFRQEVNWAQAHYQNRQFLKTGQTADFYFLEEGDFVHAENQEDQVIPKEKREKYLRDQLTAGIESYTCILNILPRSQQGDGEMFRLWDFLERKGEVGSTPKTLREELARRETEKDNPFHAVVESNCLKLQETFGLTTGEAELFLFIGAACGNTVLHRVLQFFDFSKNFLNLTADVVSLALGQPKEEILNTLRPDSALFRTGLLEVQGGNGEDFDDHFDSVLTWDQIYSLLEEKREDFSQLLESVFSHAPKATLELANYSHLPVVERTLLPYLKEVREKHLPGVNILLYGLPGTGKSELARTMASCLGMDLYEVNTETKDQDDDDLPSRLLRWKTTCSSLKNNPRALIVLDEAEDVFNDGGSIKIGGLQIGRKNKGEINQLLESNPVPTFWTTNNIDSMDSSMIRRFSLVIEVPPLPAAKRRELIGHAFDGLLSPAGMERLVLTPQLTPGVIQHTADVANKIAYSDSKTREEEILGMINRTLQAQNFGQIAEESALVPASYEPRFVNSTLDLEKLALGLKTAKRGRLCLYGPPGTGKSAYAAWLAHTLGVPLLRKTYAELSSCYVGNTEKQIAKAFKEATNEGALLLLDEADSFFRDRSLSRNSWETTAVNEMLAQLEKYSGYFVATTNLTDTMDPASLRRFDLKSKFDYLRPEQIKALAQKVLSAREIEIAEDDLERLSRAKQLAPGDFAAVLRQADFRSLTDGKDFVNRLLEEVRLKDPNERGARGRIGFR